MSQQNNTQSNTLRLPEESTMLYASKLSLKEGKPIYYSYWTDSLQNKVVIYTDKKTNDRVILKDKDEYTSPIVQKYTNNNDWICCTENSIYIIANSIRAV